MKAETRMMAGAAPVARVDGATAGIKTASGRRPVYAVNGFADAMGC